MILFSEEVSLMDTTMIADEIYCLECARFYESSRVRTWLDIIDNTESVTFRCPRGHIWEER